MNESNSMKFLEGLRTMRITVGGGYCRDTVPEDTACPHSVHIQETASYWAYHDEGSEYRTRQLPYSIDYLTLREGPARVRTT